MICSIAEFVAAWEKELETTSRVLAAMTDASLDVHIGHYDRSLAEVAWHIVTTIPEMMGATGLICAGPQHDAPPPTRSTDIKKAYDEAANGLLVAVKNSWTDASLAIEDEMYGLRWKRSDTLTALIVHEIHHRGQLSVLMRQAGLVVPSIYGPNKEEMEKFHPKG